MRIRLENLDIKSLEEFFKDLGEGPYRARQLFRWFYQARVSSFGPMTDLSKGLREKLTRISGFSRYAPVTERISSDGTRKYLFRFDDGRMVESVLIFHEGRTTACLSSQVGCQLGCVFCRTASLGFTRNLTPGEIVGQFLGMEEKSGQKITNAVFMGMGEPFLNYDNVRKAVRILASHYGIALPLRKITISTAGLVPQIKRFVKDNQAEGSWPNLAVSLNAVTNQLRDTLMPINRKYPLEQLLEALHCFPGQRRKTIMFEYILFDRLNDGEGDALKLAAMAKGISRRLNLIPYHADPRGSLRQSPEKKIDRFRAILARQHRLTPIIRESRGADIEAACGQLRAEYQP
ncbi:MAG: 23S rRNA (adenine(2503)-C(2))-methyltransferase RlmN [bacterium]